MTRRYFFRLVVILVVSLFTQHANAQREPKDVLGDQGQMSISLNQKQSGGQDAAASTIVRQYSGSTITACNAATNATTNEE